jgi:hypothetical protein
MYYKNYTIKSKMLYQLPAEAHEFQYCLLKYMNMAFMYGFIKAFMQEFQLIFRAYLLMIRYNVVCYCTKTYAPLQV